MGAFVIMLGKNIVEPYTYICQPVSRIELGKIGFTAQINIQQPNNY